MGRRREAVFDIYNLVIAAFLIVSPWLFALTRETARADAWLSGIVIALLCLAALRLCWMGGMDRVGLRGLGRGLAVAARFSAYDRDARRCRHRNRSDVHGRARALAHSLRRSDGAALELIL